MLAPLDIEIDGIKFQLKPLSPLDVFRLDKTILGLVAPALSGLGKGASGKLEIQFDKSSSALANLLIQLPDDLVTTFLTKALSRTIWIGAEGAVELKTETAINKAFAESNVMAIYKLLWEVLKYNKFSFFGLMDSGIGILKTLGLQSQMPKTDETGARSEASETLTTN